jgi:hypothetical protein
MWPPSLEVTRDRTAATKFYRRSRLPANSAAGEGIAPTSFVVVQIVAMAI